MTAAVSDLGHLGALLCNSGWGSSALGSFDALEQDRGHCWSNRAQLC